MGFGSLTSLTGGGGLSASSSSSANQGDNTFSNGFNYKAGGDSNSQMLMIGGLVLVVLFALKGRK